VTNAVEVHLPSGERRILESGEASLILKGVLELWARARLIDPVVLTVSEPGDKIYLADAATLSGLGLSINLSTLLPDVLMVDIGERPPTFWIIEAVASDGPVTEGRRKGVPEVGARSTYFRGLITFPIGLSLT
jgi:BsuBI/PstI restriction endonuclease domain